MLTLHARVHSTLHVTREPLRLSCKHGAGFRAPAESFEFPDVRSADQAGYRESVPEPQRPRRCLSGSANRHWSTSPATSRSAAARGFSGGSPMLFRSRWQSGFGVPSSNHTRYSRHGVGLRWYMSHRMPGLPTTPRRAMQRPWPASVPFMQTMTGLTALTSSSGTVPPGELAISPMYIDTRKCWQHAPHDKHGLSSTSAISTKTRLSSCTWST
jgi:hypothetical protein